MLFAKRAVLFLGSHMENSLFKKYINESSSFSAFARDTLEVFATVRAKVHFRRLDLFSGFYLRKGLLILFAVFAVGTLIRGGIIFTRLRWGKSTVIVEQVP